MTTGPIPVPRVSDLASAHLFAPNLQAAKRTFEFFDSNISNDHIRRRN